MTNIVKVGNLSFGGDELIIAAGPCAVEEDSFFRIVEKVVKAGADMIRGGAYKPRTRAGSWEGLGEKGLEMLARAKKEFGLPVVTEIIDPNLIPLFKQYGIDMLQVGARTSSAQPLRNAVTEADWPVLYKNPESGDIADLLNNVSKIPQDKCVLCLRGQNVRVGMGRNNVDITSLIHAILKTDYPIVFDPSHSTGKREYVYPACVASVSAGAHGLLIESHDDPINAITDGPQSILPGELKILIQDARELRAEYLKRIHRYREQMKDVRVPLYALIYFNETQLSQLKILLQGISTSDYYVPESLPKMSSYSPSEFTVLKARIDPGYLDKLLNAGYAIGELTRMDKDLNSPQYLIVREKDKSKLLLSPFSEKSIKELGGKTSVDSGQFQRRAEFKNVVPNDRIRDGIVTYERLKEGLGKIIIYQIEK